MQSQPWYESSKQAVDALLPVCSVYLYWHRIAEQVENAKKEPPKMAAIGFSQFDF